MIRKFSKPVLNNLKPVFKKIPLPLPVYPSLSLITHAQASVMTVLNFFPVRSQLIQVPTFD